MNTNELEQKIAMAWAGVELAKMHLDDAFTEDEKTYWEVQIADRYLRWEQLINELNKLHGGAGLGAMHPDYMALIFGFVLVMMACLGMVWSVMK